MFQVQNLVMDKNVKKVSEDVYKKSLTEEILIFFII